MGNIVDLRRITIFFVPVDLTFQFDAKRQRHFELSIHFCVGAV